MNMKKVVIVESPLKRRRLLGGRDQEAEGGCHGDSRLAQASPNGR